MRLTKNCFAILGLGYIPPWTVNAGFIVGESKTLIVDAGPTFLSAQTVYGYAHNIKTDNKLILVNTEKHLDHIGGNCFYADREIKIYGHELINRNDKELLSEIDEMNCAILNQARKFAEEGKILFENTKIVNPNNFVSNGQVINLGGVEAKIIFTPGHTTTNISVYIEKEKVLFCGDCIVNKYIPNLEAGTVENWKVWLSSLELILNLDLEFIVPGHGDIITGQSIDKELDRTGKILKTAIKEEKAPSIEECSKHLI
jgi:glyoxylase-like metal-dependent hydrolase (beta-lactamase superfamily II)